MNVWQLAWRVTRHDPRSFRRGGAAFIVWFMSPALTGFVLARGFDALQSGDAARVYALSAALAVAETARMGILHYGAIRWAEAYFHMQTLLRANMLAAQLASGGPDSGRPVASAGEAVTQFRDDAEDVANFVDGVIDTTGGLLFTALAGFVLGSADPRAATVLLGPLIVVALLTRFLDARIKRYRSADRAATAAVTGLVGDVMTAATTIKVNSATEPILGRLEHLVEARRRTAVKDQVLEEGIEAVSEGAGDVGLGLVLLVSAGALASGRFDLGLLALFAAYVGWLSFLPRMIGRTLARRKQAGVAFERMQRLVANNDVNRTVSPRWAPVHGRTPLVRPLDVRPDRVGLVRLEVEELGVAFGSGGGVVPTTFALDAGTLTVLTGPIGSGKSTLLRALLGLVCDGEVSGCVRWNGEVIADRAAFFVPPNAAFLPQVPQLLSDSIRDNVGLGPLPASVLARVLRLAELDADIAGMPASTDTLVGPRGLRLSGGQRQRLATARALAHGPELVVLDDLSSALDVETEVLLWDNLAAAGFTVLAVSHRQVAFDRADQVIGLRS